ncbi:MAG TPA: hypothetical protein ENO20_03130 [Bacteroides sp.]|mgnify:CR=1 FL=1|nr:hypothetical protein [Bacteroides sp.]
MKESLIQRFTVSSYDLNPGGQARLTSLAGFFQEIAYHHAGRLGMGYHDLKMDRTFWVLSRMKIRILRYPFWDEEIRVETWPCGLDRLFAMRDFRIVSGHTQVTGLASTAWLIVDGKTRRPVRPPVRLAQYSEGQDKPFAETLRKIPLPEKMSGMELRRVVYSDLDVVGHVNNVKYMEWCIDTAGDSALKKGIGTFEINFMHESHFGDEIAITVAGGGGEEDYFLGRISGDDLEIFRAHIIWDQALSGITP